MRFIPGLTMKLKTVASFIEELADGLKLVFLKELAAQ